MSPETYRKALELAKQELVETVAELGEAQQKATDLEIRISDLRQSVSVLSKLCGQEVVEIEDALGLTAMIRLVFSEAAHPITAQDVRLMLETRGFQTRRYGNLLASIHTVIKRLEQKHQIQQAGTREDKPVYKWIAAARPPDTRSAQPPKIG